MAITSPSLLSPYFTVTETRTTLNQNVVSQIVKQNSSRVALIFGAIAGASISISTLSTAVFQSGLQLSNTGAPTSFTFRDFGALVQVPWFAITSSVTATITVIEVSYRPED